MFVDLFLSSLEFCSEFFLALTLQSHIVQVVNAIVSIRETVDINAVPDCQATAVRASTRL